MAESAPGAPGRIFISYRREETAYAASWLYDRLADHFGGDHVFKDVDSIELGDDFVDVITTAVGSCDVLLALIGDRWLTITGEDGRRRLDDPDDFVRVEIEAALARQVRVVPILVDGARMPRDDELPPSLAKLARRQALELSPSRFDFDTDRLIKVLDKTLVEVQEAAEVREHATRPQVPSVMSSAGTPDEHSELGKPQNKERGRLSTRARILVGVGVAVVMSALLITLVVASSYTTPPPSGAVNSQQTGAVIFEEEFSSRAYGWEDAGEKRTGGHYEDGAYRIYAEPDNGGRGTWRSPLNAPSVYPSASQSLRIDVDARRLAGDQDAGYGIVCRSDADNAYAFEIIGDNAVSIAKYIDGNYEKLPLRNVDPSAVQANATNRMQAVCPSTEGQQFVHLVFSVNEHVVAEATDTHHPLTTGTVGLVVATGPDTKNAIEAEFDNFVVMQL